MAAKISENVTTLHHGLANNAHKKQHFGVYNNIFGIREFSYDVSEGHIATINEQRHLNLITTIIVTHEVVSPKFSSSKIMILLGKNRGERKLWELHLETNLCKILKNLPWAFAARGKKSQIAATVRQCALTLLPNNVENVFLVSIIGFSHPGSQFRAVITSIINILQSYGKTQMLR